MGTSLPGGLPTAELTTALRRWTGRPELSVDAVACTPIEHRISAPTTAALTRVRVEGHDGATPVVLGLVAKELQSARYGLPPQMPREARDRLDRVIPWRLEADVLASGVADRMPPGLHLPALVALHEQPEDRLTLWMEDVDPLPDPWTPEEVARAATGLGRLAARRIGDPGPLLPGPDLLTGYVLEQLGQWAVPWLLDEELWRHPLFGVPEVVALRPEVCDLAHRVGELHAALAALPVAPAHGDATPMNLLRPRSRPAEFVLVDWAMTSPAPVGYDVVPLVFGPAEAGTAPAAAVPGLLEVAVPAYRAGLASEGVDVPLPVLWSAVLLTALLRYPCTSLPLHHRFTPVTEELLRYAADRAAFVRMVLDLEQRLPERPVTAR